MEKKKIINNTFQVLLSLLLGGAILYWMYRGFNFHQVEHVMRYEMDWTWMLLSFPFGIMAQGFSRRMEMEADPGTCRGTSPYVRVYLFYFHLLCLQFGDSKDWGICPLCSVEAV